MTELNRIRVKTLAGFLFIIVPFIGWLPWWLYRVEGATPFSGHPLQWIGMGLILNGVGLAGWCVQLFMAIGKGTPLPTSPPKYFVAAGPYRFVRNPMVLGLLLVLGGEAALYQSKAVWLYGLLIFAAFYLYIRLVEEPQLSRRFGASYDAYRRQVPRWIPRRISGALPPTTQ